MLNTVGLVMDAIEKSQDLKALREARERDGIVISEDAVRKGKKGKGKGSGAAKSGAQARGRNAGNGSHQKGRTDKKSGKAESKEKMPPNPEPFVVKSFDDDFPPLG